MRLRAGARLNLRTGAYMFENVLADADSSIDMDLGAGPIVVDVTADVIMQSRVRMSFRAPDGDESFILFRVGNRVDLHEEGVFAGTFVAPNNRIRLFDAASLRGGLYGRDVSVGTRAQVAGRPARQLFLSRLLLSDISDIGTR